MTVGSQLQRSIYGVNKEVRIERTCMCVRAVSQCAGFVTMCGLCRAVHHVRHVPSAVVRARTETDVTDVTDVTDGRTDGRTDVTDVTARTDVHVVHSCAHFAQMCTL